MRKRKIHKNNPNEVKKLKQIVKKIDIINECTNEKKMECDTVNAQNIDQIDIVNNEKNNNSDKNQGHTNTIINDGASTSNTFNIPTKNNFDTLRNDVNISEESSESDDDEFTKVLKRSRAKPKTTTAGNDQSKKLSANDKKSERMPIINVFVEDMKKIINVIKYTCNITNFSTKRINTTKNSIQLYTRNDYDTVLCKMKSCNVQLFTHTPKEDKTKTFVLKGLGLTDTAEEVKEALDISAASIPNLKIVKVTCFNSAENKKRIPFFIVQISQDSSTKDLFSLKGLLYRQVTWEKLIKPGVTQCFRCQRYGHVASQCNMIYRCVKCGKSDHLPGKCQLNKESEREQLYCVQCKSYGHPASFRGCPRYQELLTKLREKRETTRSHQQVMLNNFVQPNTTYAQATTRNENVNNLNEFNTNNVSNIDILKALHTIQNQLISFEKAQKLNTQNIDFIFDVLKIDRNVQGK